MAARPASTACFRRPTRKTPAQRGEPRAVSFVRYSRGIDVRDPNAKQLHGIEEDENVGAQMNERRLHRADELEQRGYDAGDVHDADAEDEVLLDGPVGPLGDGAGLQDLAEIVGHEGDEI